MWKQNVITNLGTKLQLSKKVFTQNGNLSLFNGSENPTYNFAGEEGILEDSLSIVWHFWLRNKLQQEWQNA